MSDTTWIEQYFTWKPGECGPPIRDWLNRWNAEQACITAYHIPGDQGGFNCLIVLAKIPVPGPRTPQGLSTDLLGPVAKSLLPKTKKAFMTDAEAKDIFPGSTSVPPSLSPSIPKPVVKKAKRSSKQK